MNLLKLSFKNMVSKPLNAFLSLLLVAFSITLISVSFHLEKAFSAKLEKDISGIDMVIGAKGSPLQLILSSVLHIDAPTGNINYKDALKLSKNPLIEKAVPISYGDNYKSHRIVGSNEDFKELYGGKIATGRDFEGPMEVVLGANVAKALNLKLKDEIVSSHGLMENSIEEHEEHKLKIVGIFEPTQTILDNLIVTPLETVWGVHEHGDGNDHAHNEDRQITSLLVKFRNPMAMVQLPRQINEKTNMQAALTHYELERLFSFTGIGIKAIAVIAFTILILSAFSIFISLYRIVKERRYELALMRVYGASNAQLILVVFLEGMILSILGFFIGLIFSRAGLFIFSGYITRELKYNITYTPFIKEEAYIFLFMLILLVIATLLATIPVFKLNVSKILTDEE